MEKQTFYFIGAIKHFDQVINQNYTAYTSATSKEKAINNICFRYKKEHNLIPDAKIVLSGTINVLGGRIYDRVRV